MKRRRALTLGEAIERYRPKFEAKASAQDDQRHARNWKEALGDVPLEDITARDIERWRETRVRQTSPKPGAKKKKLAPATLNRSVAFLKRIFNLAARDELFNGRNPAATAGMVRENNSVVRWLSEDEEKRLREAMTTEAFMLVEVAFLTGMRQAEQFHLQREDVDLRTGTLTIQKSKPFGDKRYVHLGPRGKELFRDILRSHDSDWVFPSPIAGRNAPRASSGFYNVFLNALKKAKIRNFRWHDLRHTYGSRLAMAGVDPQVIRDLMGHKNISQTERYAHLCPSHLKKAVAAL